MMLFSLLSAVVTGWETENKYRVRNTLGQQVYFAAEGEYIHTGVLGVLCTKSVQERATRVRACNYVKIKTGQNFPSVLKIVTHTAQAA